MGVAKQTNKQNPLWANPAPPSHSEFFLRRGGRRHFFFLLFSNFRRKSYEYFFLTWDKFKLLRRAFFKTGVNQSLRCCTTADIFQYQRVLKWLEASGTRTLDFVERFYARVRTYPGRPHPSWWFSAIAEVFTDFPQVWAKTRHVTSSRRAFIFSWFTCVEREYSLKVSFTYKQEKRSKIEHFWREKTKKNPPRNWSRVINLKEQFDREISQEVTEVSLGI